MVFRDRIGLLWLLSLLPFLFHFDWHKCWSCKDVVYRFVWALDTGVGQLLSWSVAKHYFGLGGYLLRLVDNYEAFVHAV